MVKKAFTLMELIIVIVVLALVSVGSFKAIEMLYQRYNEVNTITKFSILSQTTLDQIGTLLYYRVPITAIGYSPSDGDFKQISEIDSDKYKIFEFINEAFNAKIHIATNIHLGYGGFVDLDASNSNTYTLVAKDFNITDINDTLNTFFDNDQDLNKTVAIIFSGAKGGGDVDSNDYNDSFGWHGHEHNKTFLINSLKQVTYDANLTMSDAIKNNKIYSKYFLVSSAWAIARGADVDKSAKCLNGMNINDNTLLLFYNYRPWNLETFCADPNALNVDETNAGNVEILAQNVTSFKVNAINYHLELKIQFSKPMYRGSDMNISISKQKVTF